MITKTLSYLLLLMPWSIVAQGLTVAGMTFGYELENDNLVMEISAPTTGWVGVGFNSTNNIVGSDLYLFHVVNGQAEGLDMYVKGIGDPKVDTTLGGNESFEILEASEKSGVTKIKFSLPFPSSDRYDFKHEKDTKFWLILAFSTHDDFAHHSRMRKHVPFTFSE